MLTLGPTDALSKSSVRRCIEHASGRCRAACGDSFSDGRGVGSPRLRRRLVRMHVMIFVWPHMLWLLLLVPALVLGYRALMQRQYASAARVFGASVPASARK